MILIFFWFKLNYIYIIYNINYSFKCIYVVLCRATNHACAILVPILLRVLKHYINLTRQFDVPYLNLLIIISCRATENHVILHVRGSPTSLVELSVLSEVLTSSSKLASRRRIFFDDSRSSCQ